MASNDFDRDKENKCILKEDLHGIFNQFKSGCNVQNQRRSARIQKKNLEQGIDTAISAADYCSKILDSSPQSSNSYSKVQENLPKGKSKSIFKEINRKYAGLEIANNLQSSNLEYRSKKFTIGEDKSEFCNLLQEDLSVHIREDNLRLCKRAINKKMGEINDVLLGLKTPAEPTFADPSCDDETPSKDLEDPLPGFSFVPSSEWVYETPPRRPRHVNIPKCTNMQPAVLYKQNDGVKIYELESSSLYSMNSDRRPLGDIKKTFVFEKNSQNNMFEDLASFDCHNNRHDKDFHFIKPSMPQRTINISPPPKITKWSSHDETVVLSEFGTKHCESQMIIDDNIGHGEDIPDDVTMIEENGNYRLTSSQNAAPPFKFTFNSQTMFGEHTQPQGSFVFNNNHDIV
ncbi:unnamed protein product [Acanthoscelides obtectus]|nr:unnamed protein product [Acanthoscelides obtectus]CAH2005732.1 unnamed protein product [Acanthoscelides obtectus]CAK1664951.1 hypothetical protein AOBTE_LOCUS24575 [Acanthoscelides obtectus]CAK1665119.1 hypothetical protein AOBTE_LOCUS24664 [Acanthoscelides obtectus]